MARTVSIRTSLLVNLVLVVVVLSAALIGTTVFGARWAVRRLSGALISRTIDQTEARLEQFFDPVVGNLQVARSWTRAGLLDLDRPGEINRLLVPLLEQYPQVSSLMVADSHGVEHMVLRAGDQWRVRQTRADEWGTRTRWLEWTSDQPEPVESWKELDYDPRRRPWYQGAIERRGRLVNSGPVDPAHQVHWTEPYIFFTTKDPGITASVAFAMPESAGEPDGELRVVGFDVLLNDISAFTTSLRPSANGVVFVMTEDGRLIGLPQDERFADAETRRSAVLKRPGELDVPAVADGARAYWEQPAESRGAYRYRSEGRAWWAGARPFRIGPDRVLMMSVAVPEADLLGNVGTMRLWIIVVTLAVLAAAVARAAALARRYSLPIEALVRQSERISRGDLDRGAAIVSTVTEVRRLARAHDRMREGLVSLMKLERDLQLARQIQQRTFPEDLPRLRGFSIDAWSEPAEETGGDTYDVVGCRSGPRGHPVVVAAGQADRALLLMADATGHGIGPALSVMQIRAMLRMAVRTGENLETIARYLNEQLRADLPEGRFITAWLGELNAADRTLTSFSAGQAPLLRYEAGPGELQILSADTLPFGIVDDLDVKLAAPMPMMAGDVFAVLSDGIFEATDASGSQFGTGRVAEVISRHAHASPSEILEALRAAIDEFCGGTPAADDRTAVVIKATKR